TAAVAIESVAVTPQAGAPTSTAAPVTTISAPAPTSSASVPQRKKAARRHKFSYKLSKKAKLSISVSAPQGQAYRTLIARAAQRGDVSLSRLVRGRALQAGTYQVTAVAVAASGKRSKPRQVSFRVRLG